MSRLIREPLGLRDFRGIISDPRQKVFSYGVPPPPQPPQNSDFTGHLAKVVKFFVLVLDLRAVRREASASSGYCVWKALILVFESGFI